MKQIIFLESDFDLKLPGSIIFEKPFRFIKHVWQRIITIFYYFIRLSIVERDAIVIVPWGLFWIAVLWNKSRIKKFSIISLTCDTFLWRKTKEDKNKSWINKIKYLLAKYTHQEPVAYIYCSEVVKNELLYFWVDSSKLYSKYQEWIRDESRMERYAQYTPNYKQNHFLFIWHCYHMLQKRLDILIEWYIEAYEKSENVDWKFVVIGWGWDAFFWEEKIQGYKKYGISFVWYTYDIDSYIQDATFYLHPGEYEWFWVAVLEWMSAGLIPLVSDITWASEAVELVNPELVIDLSINSFSHGIKNLTLLPEKERIKLWITSKTVANLYTKVKSIPHLKTKLQKIISTL